MLRSARRLAARARLEADGRRVDGRPGCSNLMLQSPRGALARSAGDRTTQAMQMAF
jgi:hypothetical protein